MAIVKTNLHDATSTDNTNNNLYNYLLENAVPEYFDSVTKSEDNTYIICTVNGIPFLKLPIGAGKFKITLGNNMVFDGATCGGMYGCAYKMVHGIFLNCWGSSYNRYCLSVLSICKDDANNTVVIYDSNHFTGFGSSDASIQSFNVSVTNLQQPKAIFRYSDYTLNITGKTVLCPIVVGDTQNYTPNAFYMPYAQNRSEGILSIDGVKYYSNGLWCIKDE